MLFLAAAVLASQAMVERAVEFTGAGGLTLRGTFTAPANASNARGLLLLPGSGPTDRDGNQPPALKTDLLKQVAAYLAGKGIATLRFDKRAAHVHAPDWPKGEKAINDFFGWEMFVGDAAAALKYLKVQKEVNRVQTGILGHSEGGLIALQLAHDLSGSERPWALVLMGTPARPMADVIREQVSEALKAQSVPQAVYEEYMAHVERSIRQLTESATVPDDLPAGLQPLFNKGVAKLLQSYFKLDPLALAKGFGGPVLVMNGVFDNQVSAEKDARALFGAVGGRGRLMLVPGASHNFKSVSALRDLGFEGPVVPDTLEGLAAWLTAI